MGSDLRGLTRSELTRGDGCVALREVIAKRGGQRLGAAFDIDRRQHKRHGEREFTLQDETIRRSLARAVGARKPAPKANKEYSSKKETNLK